MLFASAVRRCPVIENQALSRFVAQHDRLWARAKRLSGFLRSHGIALEGGTSDTLAVRDSQLRLTRASCMTTRHRACPSGNRIPQCR